MTKLGVDTALAHLKASASAGKLVAVIGTGVSMALTNGKDPALSWKGLVENGFAYGVTKGKITSEQRAAWNTQLNSSDLDDLLSAAEFMGRKLDAPRGDLYARWLESVFKDATPENDGMANALRALHSAGIPLCTLNYDPLLERVTGLTSINFGETSKVTAWMRLETDGIVHLHGSWDSPTTCILGIRDYETTVSNDVRDLIQRTLSSFGRLLFIGCGDTFADPNFSALIKWLREKMKTAAPQHYALVSAAEEARRHADSSWHGFVEPISYGTNHQELPGFLLKQFPTIAARKTKTKGSPTKVDTAAARHAKVLEDYRAFLIKDCGQMTIEGVRADMDTAQRRFDLERLFVPLKVLPTPPEIPASDPQREQKLAKWLEENKEPLPFGQVFKKHKRLALLALPGGGKTLLLKRLAVAYADAARRKSSDDELPDFDITPVLIRCREWKEQIQRPIPVLLKNIAVITGQTSLTELSDSLTPLLKSGRILLLVDGLDEIHNDADRATFVEHLEAFLNEYKLIHLVVTSREAGFSLVAPSIARFCERWRVAPLEEDAITALCDYWHRLMTGDSSEAETESREVSKRLLENASLRRLAENPLLLTMLLVVKHGAGRLPPDRVTLYDRAVEVLLDTWNIKGHEPLNLKEAVPQLACVAFELMRKGKQTATAKELLTILEEARDKVIQIRRYAKDTPDMFLKRVELRSSLLVEAGHQLEGGRTVPFYQFRHLTFQEHLAAVAAVEGHYMEYQQGDTVLSPIRAYLTAEEWKEVVPMAAVLAKKQAEPLIAEMVALGGLLRREMEEGRDFLGKEQWTYRLPAAMARLMQCLVEEAEASPETLTGALQLIAIFAKGCNSKDNWAALSQGPYGEELLQQAWALYAPMKWRYETWLRNTIINLSVKRKPETYWQSEKGQAEIRSLLHSQRAKEIVCGLSCLAKVKKGIISNRLGEIERHLFHEDPAVWIVATWAFACVIDDLDSWDPSEAILNRLLSLWWLADADKMGSVGMAFESLPAIPRPKWKPALTGKQKEFLRHVADRNLESHSGEHAPWRIVEDVISSLIIAFHSADVFSDKELAERLFAIREKQRPAKKKTLDGLLSQFNEGQDLLRSADGPR